jgi:hypothetical protein
MTDYQAITVQLKIEEGVSLLILLHRDGTIKHQKLKTLDLSEYTKEI